MTTPARNFFTEHVFFLQQQILRHSRTNASKAIFLITDGYSNGGDPRPVAAALRERGVEIFTLGIWQGNIRELHDMASQPKEQHCYLVHNFAEFEALARRALHEGTNYEAAQGDFLGFYVWCLRRNESFQNDASLVLRPELFDPWQYVQLEACYPGEIEPTLKGWG